MIDRDGYRPNVGIIVANDDAKVLWAKRIRQDAWQFPQGGIQRGESPEAAMERELHEELGLAINDVDVLGVTRDWHAYELPPRYLRRSRGRYCIGQRQKWFVLRLTGPESNVQLGACSQPEFDDWRWVDWWTPLREIVDFKKDVYRAALTELAPLAGASQTAPTV